MGPAAVDRGDSLDRPPERPVRLVFDTDIGNDIDDALALGVIHALQSRRECELLAVTITKDHELAAPFVDVINTFYGRGEIPIGVVRQGSTPDEGRFNGLAEVLDDGEPRYPHRLRTGKDAPEATTLLRRVLAAQPDHSVVIVQVGFSTNLARLLDSGPCHQSPLSGSDLAAKKVRVVSAMAGAFQPAEGEAHREYNVVTDIPSAKRLAEAWPTPIVFSGLQVGLAIPFPAASIDRDFAYVTHHPLAEAYQLFEPTPHERPCWDLTSVLWALRPDRDYFGLSAPGRVRVDNEGVTTFAPDPQGHHYYLTVDETQAIRTREAFAQLASQPPCARP